MLFTASCSPERASGDSQSEPVPEGTGGASTGGVSTGGAPGDVSNEGGSWDPCSICALSSVVRLRAGDETIVFDEAPGPQGIYQGSCGNPIVFRRSWCAQGEGELYALQQQADSSEGMGGTSVAGAARAQLNLWFEETQDVGSVAVETWGNYRDEEGTTWIFERRGGLPKNLLSSSYGPEIEFSVELIGINISEEKKSFDVEISTCARQLSCAH